MISLAGLSALPAAYNSGVQDNLNIGNQQRQRLALEAYGRTIPLLAQGMPMPGADMQPSPVGQSQQQPPPQISALLQALQARAAQQGGDPASAMATGGSTPGGGPAPPGSPTAFGKAFEAPPPQPEAAPVPAPAQRQPLNLPNTQGIRPGSLTWDQVVNAVSRANPGIPPDVLASTVDQFAPLLDQASKERWQQMQAQIQMQRVGGQGARAKLPPGYEYGEDGTARRIAGLPPDKNAGDPRKVAGLLDTLERQWNVVGTDIDRAMAAIDSGIVPSTGVFSLASSVPGTKQHDLANLLNTIKANIGFDRLQEMRNNSPTGGALGQVSDFENKLLQSVQGALEQSQSAPQLKFNLARVKDDLQNLMREKRAAYDRDFGGTVPGGGVPTPDGGGNPETIDGDQGSAVDGDIADGPNGPMILRGGKWEPLS